MAHQPNFWVVSKNKKYIVVCPLLYIDFKNQTWGGKGRHNNNNKGQSESTFLLIKVGLLRVVELGDNCGAREMLSMK